MNDVNIDRNEEKIASTVSARRKITLMMVANKIGVSVSALIRMALTEYLNNHFPGWETSEQERNE